jgi:NAD(P)-dependent dehydrogenase (short-subunit alcohol dehydrogenase family)
VRLTGIEGRVALVTGARRGIGPCIAETLGDLGARTAAGDLEPPAIAASASRPRRPRVRHLQLLPRDDADVVRIARLIADQPELASLDHDDLRTALASVRNGSTFTF